MVITVDTAGPRADAGIASRTAAELHVRRVSFRFGPPRLIGVELEWLTARADGTSARPELQAILEALGPHAPRQLAPGSSEYGSGRNLSAVASGRP